MTEHEHKPNKGKYLPKYEKNRKQKPMSFSLKDAVQVRLLELISKFEYSKYFRTFLEHLSTDEQNRVIGGDFLTIPLELFEHNLKSSGKNITNFFTINDVVRHFDQDELAHHLTDEVLLREVANRKLNSAIAEPLVMGIQQQNHHHPQINLGSSGIPVVNEFGLIEMKDEDGSTIFLEPEEYLKRYVQN